MFVGILGIIVPIAVIVVIVRALQGRSELGGEPVSVTLRRFFQYLLLLGLLIIVALGLAGLLAQVLPDSDTIARRGSAETARALAFTVVGGPLLVAMGFWTRRRLEAHEREADSLGWAFYLTVALLVGLAVTMTVGIRLLHWALSDGDIDTTEISHGIVWVVVWAVHWAIAQRAVPRRRMIAHLLAGSAAGLGVLAAGVAVALGAALSSLYSEAFETLLADDLDELLLDGAALAIVGGVVWWWYWLRAGSQAERTTLWNVYVLLVGVLGGLITALVAAGTLIAVSLEWYIGSPVAAGAADHFDVAPGAVTALLVGAAVWVYHRLALGRGTRSEIHRAYDYVVSGAGVLAVAGAVATAIIALLDAATESSGGRLVLTNQNGALIAAITLIVIGGPLWWTTWSGIRRRLARDPDEEVGSGVRRVYLFVLIGVGAIAALVGLIVTVYIVLQDLIDGRLGTRSIRDAEIAVGTLVAALAVAGYHWTIYQEDRAVLPEADESRLREVVLVGSGAAAAARAIAAATGAKVHVWARVDDVGGELVADEVVAALRGRSDERVLVIQKPMGAFDVVPVRR